MKSKLEEALAYQIKVAGLPEARREFRFYPRRMWRADFAYPKQKWLIEIHGGIFIQGRHNRGIGFAKDCQKYSTAALLGYRILHFTSQDIKSGAAITQIEQALQGGIYIPIQGEM